MPRLPSSGIRSFASQTTHDLPLWAVKMEFRLGHLETVILTKADKSDLLNAINMTVYKAAGLTIGGLTTIFAAFEAYMTWRKE
eukprot:CAMPEP_0202895610 /NCGR_PEP_ID=MMETSP1392-20130828/4769_1 /ASSEMBLY_ACC=CAM_ASM_000868 /TAXON_ID=225041 /ORGANISM="Chlamydomonas chlamydogama, Strain SAG 11-48b" /LENGTH=82 /DNA_ID=CAMNT_0049580667 /DNA_START=45 /DNA_END=293 /DNA_ORIENTATION=-